jgi:16S rRNA (guanine966-N2)-methyltransferase
MRIIGGHFRSRLLKFPKDNPHLRPTRDMVREAIFSMMEQGEDALQDCVFVDCFAGVGAAGLEAFSRGAQKVIFIEKHPRYIFENLKLLGLDKNENIQVIAMSFEKALTLIPDHSVDFIFADPPYEKEIARRSLSLLLNSSICKEGAQLYFEHEDIFEIPDEFQKYIVKQKKYGRTFVTVLGVKHGQ